MELSRSVPSESSRAGDSVDPLERVGLWALIREDYHTHGRQLSNPGFRALSVYRFNSWRLTVSPRWLRRPLTVLARFAFRAIRGRYGIELPPTARIGRRLKLVHQGCIVVHKYAEIGDDCRLLHGVTIGAAQEATRDSRPIIGNAVSIGAGAKVIGDVRIGDGAKIGPNAVVMSDLPSGATAFAAPARFLQMEPGEFA